MSSVIGLNMNNKYNLHLGAKWVRQVNIWCVTVLQLLNETVLRQYWDMLYIRQW